MTYNKAWYEANRAKAKAAKQRWLAKGDNRFRMRERARLAEQIKNVHYRGLILTEFGPCKCGFDDPRALQIDHINGGGHAERLAKPSSWKFSCNAAYQRMRQRFLDGELQVLCANCNWIKRAENAELGGPARKVS